MDKEPRWVAVFLKQLARTGNVRLAAERAGVDFTTAYQRRKRHGEFAEAWALRLSAFGARSGCSDALRQAQAERKEVAPSPGLPTASPSSPPKGGEDFAVRPDGKVIKASDARWGKRAEERFLTELTVSASVRRAATAAGFSTAAVYKRRLKDRRLAAAWDAALEVGRAQLQAHLVEAANRTFDPDELPIGEGREAPKVSVSEAINIAKLKGPSTGPGANGAGYEDGDGQFVTNEELEAARGRILDRLERIKDQIIAQEFETGCCHNCGRPLAGAPGESLYRGPVARYFLLGRG
jgi:hypothetical protein